MRKFHVPLMLIFLFPTFLKSQSYTPKKTNWQQAGYLGIKPIFTNTVNVLNFGADNSGNSSNNTALTNAIASLSGQPGVIYFPPGNYLFSSNININRDSLIIQGAGSTQTQFMFNLNGSAGNCININGSQNNSDTSSITLSAARDSVWTTVVNSSSFNTGDWVYLTMNDSNLLFSSWAYGSVGQVMKIYSISSNKIYFKSPFRYNYSLNRKPKIKKIIPKNNIGIECLKIIRMDASVSQTSIIAFDRAANCWINGIESDSTNFSHIELNRSTNIEITNSYFHHAHGYGGGGKAYGVTFQFSSGECKAEGNIFEYLRHGVLMQAGANGNVCAYNYFNDPFWVEGFFPSNAAGELVLHGNFVFSNLFEGNICGNIVIDNSHAKNGPYNTFYRNRASLFGIFMNSNPATDTVQFIGNEIPGSFNTLAGNGHFQYANQFQGNLVPSGTGNLSDTSFYLGSGDFPICMNALYPTPSIGIPTNYLSGTNEAFERFKQGVRAQCSCSSISLSKNIEEIDKFIVYPNPTNGIFRICNLNEEKEIQIIDYCGRVFNTLRINKNSIIDINNLNDGVYFIKIEGEIAPVIKIIKTSN
ncbi:MAG: glycosyl hydrolase family 28-related protein [Bacteroidota bacterium]|jgi:hypothetical protein